MKRDHICFILFLSFLLLAPKIPLGYFEFLPKRSSVSLGLLGLILWLFFGANRRSLCFRSLPIHVIIYCSFAIYAFGVSLIYLEIKSIAYATQYVLYIILTLILSFRYFESANKHNQFPVVITILVVIGMVYATGVIISKWTGPIYPHQIHYYSKRIYNEIIIIRGTGFSEGANTAGVVLMVFTAIISFGLKNGWAIVLKCIFFVALFLTFSRGAFIALLIAVFSLWTMDGLRAYFNRILNTRIILKIMVIPLCVSTLYLIAPMIQKENTVKAVLELYGFTGNGFVHQLEHGRIKHWKSGADNFEASSVFKKLFGKGFRGTSKLTNYGTWTTAHNQYLSVIGDFGFTGLILFILSFIFYLFDTFKTYMRNADNGLMRGCFVAIIGILAINFTETFLYSPVLVVLLIMLFLMQSSFKINLAKEIY
jgi:O-antigen ligase